MLELTLLVPIMMIGVTWCSFLMTQDLVLSLVMMLLSSLMLPLTFMQFSKVFWPCGLLLILMSTGLIVIFAYIVSIHSWKSKKFNFYLYMWMFLLVSWTLSSSTPATTKILHSAWIINVKVSLCLVLFFLLLFLVVSFIRIIYSKGGGFRKKF